MVDIPEKDIRLRGNQDTKIPDELGIHHLHPKVKRMMNKIDTILGSDYVYHPTRKTDKELFIEALEESGKYGI